MRIKMFDCEHEIDLEIQVNDWLVGIDDQFIIDIQYRVAVMYDERSQVYCYTCMIIYSDDLEAYLNRHKKGRYKLNVGLNK